MNKIFLIFCTFCTIFLGVFACADSATKKTTSSSGSTSDGTTYDDYATIDIKVNSSTTSYLYVSANQTYTWNVTATLSDSSITDLLTINSITPYPSQPSSMTISGSTVTFIPTSTQISSGYSFTVNVTRSPCVKAMNCSATKSFDIMSNDSSTDSTTTDTGNSIASDWLNGGDASGIVTNALDNLGSGGLIGLARDILGNIFN